MTRPPAAKRILIVDDDKAMVDYLVEMLTAEGYRCTGTTSATDAVQRVGDDRFDLVVSDIEMPEMWGIDLLAAIQKRRPGQLVILITAFGTVDLAVQAVRAGAADFVTKPFKIEALYIAIERALRERQMRREIVRLRSNLDEDSHTHLVAKSATMQRVLSLARRVARANSTVLLTGESGTGKGALARLIHDESPFNARPFVVVNCAALPTQLIEAELFGAKKGAYTDAKEDRAGLFVEAEGGTLFLDEIGELPMDSQPKLLHALEAGKVRPVGATKDVAVNVRLIAATNVSLAEAVRNRTFRQDLLYRLNVVTIDLPPLRERRDDLPALVDVFLHRACKKLGREVVGVSADVMRWVLAQAWPGNARELANTIERAVAVTDHDALVIEDVEVAARVPSEGDFFSDAIARGLPLAEVERLYVARVLQAADGNKAKAARMLGIDRRTLHRKLNESGDGEPDLDE